MTTRDRTAPPHDDPGLGAAPATRGRRPSASLLREAFVILVLLVLLLVVLALGDPLLSTGDPPGA